MNNTTNEKPQIRADLWHTMNAPQLNQQREIVLDQITLLSTMMPSVGSAPQSLLDMYGALQVALNDITQLVNKKSTTTV